MHDNVINVLQISPATSTPLGPQAFPRPATSSTQGRSVLYTRGLPVFGGLYLKYDAVVKLICGISAPLKEESEPLNGGRLSRVTLSLSVSSWENKTRGVLQMEDAFVLLTCFPLGTCTYPQVPFSALECCSSPAVFVCV